MNLDVVTTNYVVRLKPWSVGDTIELDVYVDEVLYSLIGLISSKTKLRVPKIGRQESFVFQRQQPNPGNFLEDQSQQEEHPSLLIERLAQDALQWWFSHCHLFDLKRQ